MKEKTIFVEITNQDIYDEIQGLKISIQDLKNHVETTNGKVKLNRWIATTALSLVTAIFLILLAI